MQNGRPAFPEFKRKPSDPFLQAISASGKKWIIITDEAGDPKLVLNSNLFLRKAIFSKEEINPYTYCHLPVIARDSSILLGKVLAKLKSDSTSMTDDVIEQDLILVWSDQKRIITGADILGRLMRGIALRA
jgi:hypothetical protein